MMQEQIYNNTFTDQNNTKWRDRAIYDAGKEMFGHLS